MNQPGYYIPNPHPPPPAYPYPQMPQQPKLGWLPRLIALGISLFLYLIALCSPVIRFEGGNNNLTWYGIITLLLGWQGIFLTQFGWFANIPLLVGMILLLCRRWIGAVVCILIAIPLALDSFLILNQQVPDNEGLTSYSTVTHIYFGIYFWLSSILATGIGAIVLRSLEKKLR
jgi:hypothetical protein